jgi:hypothetical protein
MSRTGGLGRRLRLGMVGGGAGSLIGDSHRIASRMDDCYELAAGAFDIDPSVAERLRATSGCRPSAPTAPGGRCWKANAPARTAAT